MKLRLMTVPSVPLFTEHGISANNERWTEVDVDKLTPADRRAVVSAHKRLLLVHEADEQKFADLAESLKFEDEPKKKK